MPVWWRTWSIRRPAVLHGVAVEIPAKRREDRFGRGKEKPGLALPYLIVMEQAKADGDTVLWLRTLLLMTSALEESMECAIALEQPEDPSGVPKLHALSLLKWKMHAFLLKMHVKCMFCLIMHF